MQIEITNRAAAPPGPCAMQQHPYYADALRLMGAQVLALTARDGARRIAQAQVVQRRIGPLALNWLPRGPVWSGDATQAQRCLFLDLLPQQPGCGGLWIAAADAPSQQADCAAAGFRALMTGQYVAELPLGADDGTRLARQAVKWRNRLKHARKSPLICRHRAFDPRRDGWLLTRDAEQRRKHHYSALPAAFTLAYAQAHPGAARLFLAQLQGQTVAALLILRHPPTASYHIGWSGADGRRHSAHNLLLWEASVWLRQQGCQRLDLGTVDTETAPGLARFKIGSGAHVRPLGPTMMRFPGRARRLRAA